MCVNVDVNVDVNVAVYVNVDVYVDLYTNGEVNVYADGGGLVLTWMCMLMCI